MLLENENNDYSPSASTRPNGSFDFELIEYSTIKELNQSEEIRTFLLKTLFKLVKAFDFASSAAFQGDSYRFFYLHNLAIHQGLIIHEFLNNNESWHHPKNVLRKMTDHVERNFLINLFPTPILEQTNKYKQAFLDWIEDILDRLEEKNILDDSTIFDKPILEILSMIYKRDFFWNVRAVGGIKNAFRSPDPAAYLLEPQLLKQFLEENNITLILDLRGEKEANPSEIEKYISKWNIKRKIVDFNEPNNIHDPEHSYVKKLKYQGAHIREAIESIANNDGAVIFHCHSGKDRTGVLAALLQLFCNIDEKQIRQEYLKSGHDVQPEYIDYVLEYIKKKNGILNYLKEIGINEEYIIKLRKKLCN